MYRDHTVGVVIPAFNEEGFIAGVIRGMPEYVDRIYVIDDCSTDGTWDEIVRAAREGSVDRRSKQPIVVADGGALQGRAIVHDRIGRVFPLQHTENRGAGGAIKTGYMAALGDELDIVATVDGDGQMDIAQLPRLLDPIVEDAADYTKGNRLLDREYRRGMPRFRFFGNTALTLLTKIASGYWKTMDPQNGYTAISLTALKGVHVEELYEYYGYCNDLLVKLNVNGGRVADVAIPAVYGDEKSSINYSGYIRRVSSMLLRNFLWRLRVKYLVLDFHPLVMFYYLGAIAIASSLAGGSYTIYGLFVGTASPFVQGMLLFIVFMIGSLFLGIAMVFDMQTNQTLESQFR